MNQIDQVCEGSEEFHLAVEALRRAGNVAVVGHINPDGDTLGSTLALVHALNRNGKHAVAYCDDVLPSNLSFLPGYDDIKSAIVFDVKYDTIITVDASDTLRLGDVLRKNREQFEAAVLVNIDHHATSACHGQINVVDRSAAASGEIVASILDVLGWPLDLDSATCLMAALITDTRVFRTANTTPRTLALAARLLQIGAPLNMMTEFIYRNRALSTLKLWGAALQDLRIEGGIAWTCISEEMQQAAGAQPHEGDGVIDLISSLSAVTAVVLFRAIGNETKVSMRSTGTLDVSKVAAAFAGGGHPRAAGCTLSEPVDKAVPRVLEQLQLAAREAGMR